MSLTEEEDKKYAQIWMRRKTTWYPIYYVAMWFSGIIVLLPLFFGITEYILFTVIGYFVLGVAWMVLGEKIFWLCPKCGYRISDWHDELLNILPVSEKVVELDDCPSCHVRLHLDEP